MSRAREWAGSHPVLCVFILALGVRVLAAIALTATVGMDKFPDTQGYDRLATERANGDYHAWDETSEFFWDRYTGFLLPLATLYRVFGSHLFSGQLLAAVLGAVAAGAICRLLLEVTTRQWALVGGLIVAFFPSQVLWSSVAYKDSAVWAATACMAVLAAWAARAAGWRLAACGIGLGALLFWLGHLRRPTLIVTAWALVIAAAFSAPSGRAVRVVGAVAIAALIPWYIGVGPGGVTYASSYSPSEVRAESDQSADTTFVDESESSGAAEVKHLPRGVSIILLEPYPWTSFRGYEVRVAQAELLVWYPLMVVAAFGIPTVFRRRRELAFLVVTAGGMLGVYALYEGNFGTALRHRSELVPALAVGAALGAPVLWEAWQRRREVVASPTA